MEYAIKEYLKFNEKNYTAFILGGDIGGTKTNLGIFGIKNKFPTLLVTFHFNSHNLKGLSYAINETLNYVQANYKIMVVKACLGVAGILSHDGNFAILTNCKWNVSKKMLLRLTGLKEIVLINDFEAIGYAVNILKRDDFILIKKARKIANGNILVIGAGTGLGKTTLVYDRRNKSYVPIPSEAGHSDFGAQNKEELELINFIKKQRKIRHNLSYELLLSGRGLINIYLFRRKNKEFEKTEYTIEIDKSKHKPELISKFKNYDTTCKLVFQIFIKILARFAKNFALDCLPFGGIYIAGGIAHKNREIFDEYFIKIFEDNYKHKEVLKSIPIYLIINNDVGLLGSGFLATRIFGHDI